MNFLYRFICHHFLQVFKDKEKIFQKGNPLVVSFHPIEPLEIFLNAGYAVIVFTDYCSSIAQDNNLRKGAFYDLYPYSENPETQTGVLMAWSWGASKILDALYNGAAKELFLDTEASIITRISMGKGCCCLRSILILQRVETGR